MYLNKMQIIGNLTRDPELKALPSGSKVCNLSVATNYTYKDASGQKQETVEFHSVTFYGKMAETVAQYFVKGQQIYVEGRLQTRNWEKDGVKHYRTEIVANDFMFGRKPGEGTGQPYQKKEYDGSVSDEEFDNYGKEPQKPARKPTMAKSTMVDYPNDDINPEDIPF